MLESFSAHYLIFLLKISFQYMVIKLEIGNFYNIVITHYIQFEPIGFSIFNFIQVINAHGRNKILQKSL